MLRRFVLWGACFAGVTGAAQADPVPVSAAGVAAGAAGAPEARAAAAVGADALGGTALRDALLARFGRFAPREDTLAGARAEVTAGWDAYFRSGPRAARRRLSDAVTAMEAAGDALALRDDNRGAYLRAVGMLARIDLEARRADDAEAWARRGLRLDPGWTPPASDFPPPVLALVTRLRGAEPPRGEGRLTVRLPREGCGVTVDGAALPGTAREPARVLAAGRHRVWAACEGPSRVREVAVRAGETTAVVIDPALDARLQLSDRASLVYTSARDQDALLLTDLAALGAALGAARVVAVNADGARVVEVAGARLAGEVAASRGDFDDALRALRDGRAVASATSVAAPPPLLAPAAASRASTGPGAAPWGLVGAGGALVAAGAVLWVLRSGAYEDLSARCPFVDGAPACPDAESLRLAGEDRDRANLYQGLSIGAFAAGGVALTSGLLWYALGGRSAERVTVRAGLRGGSVTVRW
ncbi:MAG: hypothetical protein U0325_05785 [Polyangiales bacterium]